MHDLESKWQYTHFEVLIFNNAFFETLLIFLTDQRRWEQRKVPSGSQTVRALLGQIFIYLQVAIQ